MKYTLAKTETENELEDIQTVEMQRTEQLGDSIYRYTTNIGMSDGGEYGYTFRVYPYRPDLINKFELGTVKWVMQ